MSQHNFPAFGDILNTAIQVIKTSSNRKGGIAQKTFMSQVIKEVGFTPEQLNLTYTELSLGNDPLPCMDKIMRFCIQFLVAIGLVWDDRKALEINGQCDNFLDFVAFNETVTSDNLIKLDPFGKIFFWLANDNFFNNIQCRYYDDSSYVDDDYLSSLKRFDELSFQDYKSLQKACYGNNGDPLLNFLIQETMRRTSVFMNNYANATLLNDFEKATHGTILKKITKLTPIQFEHLCLRVVERSLLNESPNTVIATQHTGKANDGGIDGKLTQTFANGEVHYYYIQAKLYQSNNKISNRDLRNFVGAYTPNPTFHHGIFITTSDYTANAVEYKNNLNSHSLILINQTSLLELMIEHEVGLETVKTEALVLDKEFFRKLPK